MRSSGNKSVSLSHDDSATIFESVIKFNEYFQRILSCCLHLSCVFYVDYSVVVWVIFHRCSKAWLAQAIVQQYVELYTESLYKFFVYCPMYTVDVWTSANVLNFEGQWTCGQFFIFLPKACRNWMVTVRCTWTTFLFRSSEKNLRQFVWPALCSLKLSFQRKSWIIGSWFFSFHGFQILFWG